MLALIPNARGCSIRIVQAPNRLFRHGGWDHINSAANRGFSAFTAGNVLNCHTFSDNDSRAGLEPAPTDSNFSAWIIFLNSFNRIFPSTIHQTKTAGSARRW